MNQVSVIIPIYNVEQYLEKCLESVINQTYKDLEIICVNDCSPDNSAEILKKYAERDDRIILVNREKNGGLSAARNSGLEIATGEYIYFLDSDDWIDLDYIKKMVETIENTNADIVYNANVVKEEEDKSSYVKDSVYKYNSFYENNDAINKPLWSVWSHIYKRKLLVNYKIAFPEGYIYEDVFFQHVVKYYVKKIYAFWGSSYHYFVRKGSITRRKTNIAANHVKVLKLVNEFYSQFCSIDNLEIKLFKGYMFSQINDEEEFQQVKEYLLSLNTYLKNKYYLFSDYEQFLIKGIINSESVSSFIKKIGKNSYLTYITREKLIRQKNINVSVIIPVYNVEQYLEKCLDSVCQQTLNHIEIICINDCSSDNSLEILQEYAKNDNRIKLIDFKENKGGSAARNAGIDVAKGKYIGFVDAHNHIDLDFYEKLYHKAIESNSNLLIGNIKHTIEKEQFDSFEEAVNTFMKNKLNFNRFFTFGLYKKELLLNNNITFIENSSY